MRIYHVMMPDLQHRLIRAKTRQQALVYVAETKFNLEPANQELLVKLVQAGVQVENAVSNQQQTLDLGGSHEEL